ncbi:MAG: hypothetical protein ABR540_09490 [Acidimicrobiales bacterium]
MPTERLGEEQRVDFFVSCTGADVAWAEWVAWVLDEAGTRRSCGPGTFGRGRTSSSTCTTPSGAATG